MRGPCRQRKAWKPRVFKPDRAFATFINRKVFLKGKQVDSRGRYKAVTRRLKIPLSQPGQDYDEAAWKVRRKGPSFTLWLDLKGYGQMSHNKLLVADLDEQTISYLGEYDFGNVNGLHPGDRAKVLNLPELLQVVADVFGWNQQLEWFCEPSPSGDMRDRQMHWVRVVDAQGEPWYYCDSPWRDGQRQLSEEEFVKRREQAQQFYRLYAMHWLPPDLVQRFGQDRFRAASPGGLFRNWLNMVDWCLYSHVREMKIIRHRNPGLRLPYGIFRPEDNYRQPMAVLKPPRDFAQEYGEQGLAEAARNGHSVEELEETLRGGIEARMEDEPDLVDFTLALDGIPLNGRPGYSQNHAWLPPLMSDGLTPLLAGEELVVRGEPMAHELPGEGELLVALRSETPARQLRALEAVRGTKDDSLLAGVMDTMMWSNEREVRARARSIFRQQAPGGVLAALKKHWRPEYRIHKSPPLGALVDELAEHDFMPYALRVHGRGIRLAQRLLSHDRPHPKYWDEYLPQALERLGTCARIPLEEIRQSILETGETHVINAPETLSFHPFEYTAEDIEKLQALATGEAG